MATLTSANCCGAQPTLGRDTESVLEQVLGITPDEFAKLFAAGVV